METTNVRGSLGKAKDLLQRFIHLESAGGLVLMAATVVAMIVANSPLRGLYESLLEVPFSIKLGGYGIAKPVLLWINDGLMAIFFFLVGLELKRELAEGRLATLRHAALPAVAAVGGMAVPAILYISFSWRDPVALRGWAIPTATDIAFALGVLSLLGRRVPSALKAFLLSVAIFDDLGAVLVIAAFYTAKISLVSLAVAGIFILALAGLNRAGVTRPLAYFAFGLPLWVAVLKSGVHATLAGVLVAAFIPLRRRSSGKDEEKPGSPLHHLEEKLHPWVAFGVLPIFAFANAGIPLTGLSITDILRPVPLGIMVGLFLGKQLGVLSFSALAVRLGMASLPAGVRWRQLYGVALICGIGFTMSLFIASLAFEEGGLAYSGLERLGILLGSLASGALGYGVLRVVSTGEPLEKV